MSSDFMLQVGEQASRPNPWPLYAQLRQDRVVRLEPGSYAVGRYDDVLALLHDPRVSSDPHTLTNPGDRLVADTLPFINQDPPGHDRMRREVTRFFGPPDSPGLVTGQEPEIDRQIGTLIDAFPECGEVDLVDDFAYPLPVAVICRLLGVPPADEPQFQGWAEAAVGGIDAAQLEDGEQAAKRRQEGLLALFGYLGELVKKHRGHPDGSMLSGLANDHGPDAMSDTELQVTGVLLLIAGHETTVNLITNGMLTLLRNPGALARLRREPAWVVPVVEELLRIEPPVQYLPNRAALADITIAGTTIPQGSKLNLLLAAANRDPGRFTDPDRFDPDRPDNQHLGFGSGLHYCFGAPLARLEVHQALAAAGQPARQPQADRRPAALQAQPGAAWPDPSPGRLRRAPDPLAGQPHPMITGPVPSPASTERITDDQPARPNLAPG